MSDPREPSSGPGAAAGKEADRPRIRRIGELLSAAKLELERRFSDFWIEGELADVKKPPSGHVYFTLVEPGAQVRGVMWRGDALRARAKLEDGVKVRLRCSVTIFEERGTFQIVAKVALQAGDGDAAAELERLRQKLTAEGLFDPARKRPLPRVPRVVGVVTSLEGAALRDVIRVATGRMGVRLVVSPSPVQGPDAPPLLVRAIKALSAVVGLDVVIVARGGGASEDLAAFNDERVVRAIAACPVPVVSGVGHEVDVTLSDLAADARAATPSNAAELAVPDARALEGEVLAASRRVDRALDAVLEAAESKLLRAVQSLGDPRRRLARVRNDVLASERRIEQVLRRRVVRDRGRLEKLRTGIDRAEPRARLSTQRAALDRTTLEIRSRVEARLEVLVRASQTHTRRIEENAGRLVPARRAALAALASRLSALSPLAVLGRGYAIALHEPTGRALVRAADADVGDRVVVRLADGALETEVRSVRPPDRDRP